MATQILRQSVVVFSKNYLPINQINIKRAIILLVTGKAEPLDFNNSNTFIIYSPSTIMRVPQQIRLTINHVERSWRAPTVNRREILRRDKHTCQYCGSSKRLTIDHIIPRSKGGNNSWDNVVTACEYCNSHKGDRTPLQAGLTLRSKPKTPLHPIVAFAEQFWRAQHALSQKNQEYRTYALITEEK